MMSKQMPIKFTEKERRKEKKNLNTCIGKIQNPLSRVQTKS